jgi:hypothetical protein
MFDFTITRCNISEITVEIIRYIAHITLLHLFDYSLSNGEVKLFSKNILRSLLFTTLAIIIYNLFIKKIFMNKIKDAKEVCSEQEREDERKHKKLIHVIME